MRSPTDGEPAAPPVISMNPGRGSEEVPMGQILAIVAEQRSPPDHPADDGYRAGALQLPTRQREHWLGGVVRAGGREARDVWLQLSRGLIKLIRQTGECVSPDQLIVRASLRSRARSALAAAAIAAGNTSIRLLRADTLRWPAPSLVAR